MRDNSSISTIEHYGLSITGRRDNNQDKFLCRQINENTFFYAVADGMGGSRFGEIASGIVLQDIELFLSSKFKHDDKVQDLKVILHDCFLYLQERFIEYTNTNAEHAGMGTTLVVLLVHDQKYVWGNLGDSRLYRIMDGRIDQLTIDHTYIQQLKEQGKPVDDEIHSRFSHLLTRCINGGMEMPDIFPVEKDCLTLQSPSGFILCSDGMILNKAENLNDYKLKEIFLGRDKLSGIAEKLINYAYSSGSGDNITAVVVRFGVNDKKERRKPKLFFFLLTVAVTLIALYYLFGDHGAFEMSSLFNGKRSLSASHPDNPRNVPLSWQPLDIADKVYKSPSSYLSWNPYPDNAELKGYCITVWDLSNTLVQKKRIRRRNQYIQMGILKNIDFSRKYYIRVDAELKNGSVKIGNTILIQTKAEQ
jgi:PPM family protein phosphatase